MKHKYKPGDLVQTVWSDGAGIDKVVIGIVKEEVKHNFCIDNILAYNIYWIGMPWCFNHMLFFEDDIFPVDNT